jgi:hypothetical protein
MQSSGAFAGYYSSSCPPNCGFVGQPDSRAQVDHAGAAGTTPSVVCPAVGGAGYPIQALSQTVGGGGAGFQTYNCAQNQQINLSGTPGQNGYAVLTW